MIVGASPELAEVLRVAAIVARRATPVLILGESGTGKELLARHVHALSPRAKGPFVAVNCAALPRDLLEAELFGHERGAFTGAIVAKPGRFERAAGGTLVLDEIGDLALDLQAKLLRVLQEREVERIGATRTTPVDVRVIAITNRDLRAMGRLGTFRQDLYWRLAVVPIVMPPLRARAGDLDLLTDFFLGKFADHPLKITTEARMTLARHTWPGNVRELENVLHRAALLAGGPVIESSELAIDWPDELPEPTVPTIVGKTLREVEQRLIQATLVKVSGNQAAAARVLGISYRTLRNKLDEYEAQGVAVAVHHNRSKGRSRRLAS